jgi:ABC-2 type transport system permease protein
MKSAWPIVAGQEMRDLWIAGRGLPLTIAYSLLLSVITYLVATNTALNFLEQRESVNVVLQVGVATAAPLESLLLAPARRADLVAGKGLAVLTLWGVAYLVAIPYVWFLGRGVGVFGLAVVNGLLVGLLLGFFLVGLGLLVSTFWRSNRISLSVSFFILLALFAPTQLPSAAQGSWVGDMLLRIDPMSSGLHYLGRLIVDGRSAGQELSWLIGPAIAAALAVGGALVASRSLGLRGGAGS